MLRKDEEQASLVDDILGSPSFAKSQNSQKLLRVLLDWQCVKGGIKGSLLAFIAHGSAVDSNVFGVQISELKQRLEEYAATAAGRAQKWRCALPNASGKGYKLELKVNPDCPISATELFWQAHVDPRRPVFVICNELTFFQDLSENSVVRFFDVNPEHTQNKAAKRDELRRLHPNAHNDGLEPVYIYLVAGEVAAADALNEWFAGRAETKAPRITSHTADGPQILASSPILLGSTRTNRYMGQFLSACPHFGYRFTEDFGEVRVLDLTLQEQEKLRPLDIKPDDNGDVLIGKRKAAKGDALGFAFRIPNPGGQGAVTMIASDYTPVIKQIALALIDDSFASTILNRIHRPPEKSLPASFELLFSVPLEPGNLEYQAGQPSVVGYRLYDRSFTRIR